MKLVTAITLTAGVAAGYFGARQLLDHEELVERVPAPVRPALVALRGRLVLARQRAEAIVAEYERERSTAEQELLRDYYTRVGRSPGTSPAANSPEPPTPRT